MSDIGKYPNRIDYDGEMFGSCLMCVGMLIFSVGLFVIGFVI